MADSTAYADSDVDFSPDFSKREYLLAQIRQKDNIIESLLKQLHNPYVATPLSIASYRMATSPSDQNNTNVLAWLERLQASVRDGPKTGSSSVAGGPSSGAHVGSGLRHSAAANSSFPINTNFGELRSASETIDDEESDNETTADRRTQRGRGGGGGGLVPVTSTVGIRATVGSDVVSRSSSLGGGVGPSGGSSTADTTTTPADDPEDESAADKMSRLPTHVPLGLIADLSLSNNKAANRRGGNKDPTITEAELDDDNVGVANETYFMPGPATDLGIRATLIEQHSPPEIIVHGLVKPEDVEKLFQIFYEKVNPFISILDPVLHTPASTFSRCPFLFTVICAISSRYYVDKSEIYPIAMHFAKHSAANALIDGWKSVELCQAYILMSIYAVPARRWEEDRSWLYTGLAIRIATDLNLHHAAMLKPTSERHEREILNKIRVWMICFNLDRSTATQFGKPSTIKEDFIIRDCKDWYKKSQYNIAHDIHLCAYSAMLQIVASFHEEVFSDPSAPTGLNKKVDFRAVTLIHDGHLTEYHKEWQKRFDEESDPNDPSCVFRCSLLPFLVGYSRLVMYSFGFQQAFIRGFEASDRLFLTTCFSSAKSVIENMIDGLAPSGYMRYAPDGHFIFASFASAFLLKLLRPEFSSIIDKEMENEIFDLIGRLIQTLSSPRIAIDDRHTPKLYARFLAGLLSRHRRDGATVGRLQTNPQGPSGGIAGSGPGGGAGGSSGMSTFSISGAGGGGKAGDASSYGGQNPGGMSQALDTPVYVPEATFAGGGGAIHLASDYDIAYGGTGVSDEEMLATMQAIKNPAWWSNMMMPGFSWPEASPSPSGSVHSVPPPSYQAAVGMDGIQSFGMYPSQVMM